MKKISFLFFCLLLALDARTADVTPTFDVWQQPLFWLRHTQLRNEFIGAVRRGDTKTMEAAS